MTRKRKAHFLPRFFLAGFTSAGDRSDFLHVRSKKQQRTWKARAEEVAHQRDLFTPEGPQYDPNEFEDGFAAIESDIAPVLRKVIATERLPDGKDLDILLHLVALNGARPPAEMEHLQDGVDEYLRRDLVLQMTPEVHQRIVEEWRAQGRDTSNVEDLDALKTRILDGGIRVVVNRDYFLVMGVLGRASTLVDLLGERSWTLLVAEEGAEFICGDRPVTLLNNQNLPADVQPRYDDTRFDVIMPLSKRLCLVGHHYGPGGTSTASARTVGFINHITETGAEDFVYSATEGYNTSSDAEFGLENGQAYRHHLGVRIR